VLSCALVLVAAPRASAQTDEIQVYDGGLTDIGTFNLTWHSNFTPKGIATPAFPSAIVADHSFNSVTEWAYGVTKWFEAALYLPLYTHDKNIGSTIDGFKLRALFAAPRADDRRFFYGVNFEFSVNSRHWDANRITSEVRPIVGWHLKPWDIIVNPILDTSYNGLKNLDFVPATRIAHNFPGKWAVAVEEYANYGPVRRFFAAADQAHVIYGVVNHATRFGDIEAGMGIGVTTGSDKVTLKLLFSKDLN
jgi:hypothetical protein